MKSRALLLCSALAGVSSTLLPSVAHAAAPGGSTDDNLVSYEPPATERRGGFAVGVTGGLSLVNFSGYPNRVTALGDPDQQVDTGAALGNTFGVWAGGAIRDWLTVGGGLAGTSTLGGDYVGSSAAFVLHVEGFPLWALGGGFRDLGLSVDGGLGVARIYAASDQKLENVLADAGLPSFVSTSVFYEPFRFWHFSTGPALTVSHTFSQTMTVSQGMLGWRFVFYADQPKKPAATASGSSSSTLF